MAQPNGPDRDQRYLAIVVEPIRVCAAYKPKIGCGPAGCVGKVLKPGARVHYIVGNSTFYGVLVPTERFYADLLQKAGFTDVGITVIRKRNSKTELLEFDVSAVWGG